MKLLDRNKGLVKVVVETADDLWYLHTIVDSGDKCTGDSEYKYKIGGSEAKAQVVKKRVWVTLDVEKTEFEQDHLRISGKVIDGSEEVPRGSFHSLDVGEGTRLTLEKERWLEYQVEKLEEAIHSARLHTLLVLYDRESAIFAVLKPNGYDVLLTLKGDVPKKGVDESKVHSFYKEIVKHLEEFAKRFGIQHAIAASPSFWKEYLEKELTPELRKQVIFSSISTVDETAINEILGRPELQQALKAERSTRELVMVERILLALAKDQLIYGFADLQNAIAEGNLAEIIVSERAIMKAKEEENFQELETLMHAASHIKARVHLLSTTDAMGKIDGFGGVVGVKRW
jgi:mRNA surveillance protein pelota